MDIKQKIALSTTLGATFTWYDFLVFNIAVVLVFPKLFFPDMSAMIPILVFAVGFLARPLGSMIFGYMGDRLGRKISLIGTLMLTGISTVLIGLLPTHEQIGIAATILLISLRILQTTAVGGEWAAASVLLAEHNSKARNQSFLTSFVNSSFALGSLMASLVFFLVTLPGDEFLMEVGWRIPFLISAVLLIIGVYMRRKVTETPAFAAIDQEKKIQKNPLKILITKYHKTMLLSAFSVALAASWSYTVMVFGSSYMLQSDLISRQDLTGAQLLGWTALGVIYVWTGWLGDRIDRYRLFIVSTVLSILLCWPVFLLLEQGQALYAILLLCLLTYNLALAPLMFAELYPAEIRQTGAGVSYNLGLVMAAVMVVISQQILAATQNIGDVAYAFMTLSVISLASIVTLWRKFRVTPV